MEPPARSATGDGERVASRGPSQHSSPGELVRERATELDWAAACRADDRTCDLVGDLDAVVERLQELEVAHQHFKGLFLQSELAKLSRLLMYVGIPAVLVSIVTLLTFAAPQGSTLPVGVCHLYVPLSVTGGFVPLALLFSFVLRAATIARRTVTTSQFTSPPHSA